LFVFYVKDNSKGHQCAYGDFLFDLD